MITAIYFHLAPSSLLLALPKDFLLVAQDDWRKMGEATNAFADTPDPPCAARSMWAIQLGQSKH